MRYNLSTRILLRILCARHELICAHFIFTLRGPGHIRINDENVRDLWKLFIFFFRIGFGFQDLIEVGRYSGMMCTPFVVKVLGRELSRYGTEFINTEWTGLSSLSDELSLRVVKVPLQNCVFHYKLVGVGFFYWLEVGLSKANILSIHTKQLILC